MNGETIFVLLITAVAAGTLAWLEIHSRRNKGNLDESKIDEYNERAPEVRVAGQPRPKHRVKSR